MNLFGLDLSRDLAVIAEVGVNHEGDVDVAARLVESVAKAGAHAVKFQSYTPERFILANDAERFARVTRFSLDEAAHRRLAKVSADNGIAFFSSAISEDWVPLIAELGAAIKIASGDLTFEPVIAAAAKTGKPVILSTGAGDAAEVDRAVDWFKTAAGKQDVSNELALLHCVSGYPTPIEQANLLSIPFLANRYGLATGWSNHVIGQNACIGAVALGAAIVEVHVTDRKEGRTFRDHSLSFEPVELAELTTALKAVRRSLGVLGKEPADIERESRGVIRKGVIAARDLRAGAVITASDLMYARPATDIPSTEVGAVIGRRLAQNVARGAPLTRQAIAG